MYKISKTLAGRFTNRTTAVRDRNGQMLATQVDQRNRWAEHFREILNRPDPEEEADVDDTGFYIEVDHEDIIQQEIEQVITQTKGNRASGEDRVTSDILKADPISSAKALRKLFSEVWKEEKVPKAWNKSIIIKLPMKGDLSVCSNWRGISLLSIPGKMFCRVLLQRLRQAIERILREEQAGFRAGRGCVDQTFTLRTIVEQSLECSLSLYINYIDFEKAFDSIHHPSLWKILAAYGIPAKVMNI